MKQNLGSSKSSLLPSYEDSKGWSSERVPHTSSNQSINGTSSRRHTMSAAWAPFYSGRALPSKWDDAERWICSPVSAYNGKTSLPQSQQYMRRPKSKSGPIVPPGVGYYSPSLVHGIDGGSVRNFVMSSPFSTGVLMPNGVGVHVTEVGGAACGSGRVNDVIARLPSLPNWSDLVSESSLPSSRDERVEETQETEASVTHAASRRDMATQMSPGDSTAQSSPKMRSSPSPSQADHPTKLEIREVQVDNRATVMNKSSKGQGHAIMKQGLSPYVNSFNRNGDDELVPASPWALSEAASDLSKLQREEAKITAWENLQKAKAEAAIRKLEMKLEKKRSSSMDKILKKLRKAQNKAQEMRSSTPDVEEHRVAKKYQRISSINKHARLIFMTGCFTCRAS